MIAPLQLDPKDGSTGVSPKLRAARAAIAAMLLRDAGPPVPAIATWKAWLFVAWLCFSITAYALSMSGIVPIP